MGLFENDTAPRGVSFTHQLINQREIPMTAMNTQVQLAIDNFDVTLIPGSVKKLMKSIKAEWEGTAEDQANPLIKTIKGAGGSSDLWKVPVSELKVLEGFNVRLPGPDLDAHIAFLTQSIKNDGFYQHRPLAALVLEVDGVLGLYVFDGHCRLQGTQNAISEGSDLEMLPVVVQDGRNVNLEDLWVQMYNLNKGREHTPFEVGLLCKRLAKNGHKDAEIGKRMGIKPQYVDSLLRLVNAPKQLVDAVVSNELAASEAIKMIRSLGNGKVVEELENRRARALAEQEATTTIEQTSTELTTTTNQPRPRLTGRHASNAHVKKVVSKHGMELFQTARALVADPAYQSLSVENRMKLDELLLYLANAEKADTIPAQDDEANVEGIQAAA
jgi:ParB family chromosome partitioning protein